MFILVENMSLLSRGNILKYFFLLLGEGNNATAEDVCVSTG